MYLRYLIVVVVALQLSITFSEHFNGLPILPFRYAGSIAPPDNDHYVVKP